MMQQLNSAGQLKVVEITETVLEGYKALEAVRRPGAHAEPIPLFYPPKQDLVLMLRELKDTLSGRWWGQGPKVDRFEAEFGRKFGFQYCVMVNSGTAALHLAYILARVGFRPFDEVIVPVLTCTATCHPILHCRAKIVFADVRPDTLTLDWNDVLRKTNPRTRIVLPVHLGGLVADIESMKAYKAWHPEISIVEDACQALGADGLGNADFTCFSFQAIKTMTTGDGGMLICNDLDVYKHAKRLRWFGIDREQKAKKNWQAWDRRGITFDQYEAGYKYQPTDIDASIGLAALQTIDQSLEHRKGLAVLYQKLLADVPGITLLNPGPEGSNAWWLFMVLVEKDRDGFAAKLADAGIETNLAHIRNDFFSVFGGAQLPLPGMDEVEEKYICLPINDHVSEDDVRYICMVIRAWSEKRTNEGQI